MSANRLIELEAMLGRRIANADDIGTVKFVGEVPPATGVWLGVEWDDPQRGKHNGTKNGVQYFSCCHPTGGSFLRPAKADFGRDIMSAIREKYIPKDMETGDLDESVMSLGTRTIELVGIQKIASTQSCLENLRDVALRNQCISTAGEESLSAPNIKGLNLSRNLLPSWEELSRITGQLKKLQELDVSENRLTIPSEPASFSANFSSLAELFLNRVYVTWDELLVCAPMWLSLRKLHFCFNRLPCINRSPDDVLQGLELLNLEGNVLSSWDDVLLVAQLPRLKKIVLNSNKLSQICFPDASPGDETTSFSQLQSMSLSNNEIDEWSSISELNKLKSLEEMHFRSNPLIKDVKPGDVRGNMVAKIRRLKKLNGTEEKALQNLAIYVLFDIMMALKVLRGERRGAEIDYLKHHCKEWLASGGSRDPSGSKPSEAFLTVHPTYEYFIGVYGAPEDGETRVESKDLKSTLIEVKITCPQDPSKKQLKKKLPGAMELQKLKSLVQKLYKIDVCQQKVFYTRHKREGFEIEMDNDLRPLDFFGIESGDTILIKY